MADHITVCICTYRRPQLLRDLLQKVIEQETGGHFTLSIAVCDNDTERSAEGTVAEFQKTTAVPISYSCEPDQNIARARNRVLESARGNFVAFIDDDEFPAADWLRQMFNLCESDKKISGVLGPVRPHFEEEPPAWIVRGRFCERPEHPTGRVMKWNECRTGNVLFRRSILHERAEPFKPHFGTGGEDMDFFRRMIAEGNLFLWCAEAVVYEVVPPARLTRAYMLKRALLRGKNILKHQTGRSQLIATSLAAFPFYLLMLPLTAIGGQHCLMRYSIKLCDHAGRLLGLLGLNPVSSRDH